MSSPAQALTHRFAWDGFSFDVPADWNLSEVAVRRDTALIRMEDDAALRLELQWIRSARPVDPARFQDRYGQAAQRLAAEGAQTTRVDNLPPSWSAFLYSMPEGNRLLTAFRMMAGDPLFCFFQLHFPSASLREPVRLIRALALSFMVSAGDLVAWACYDFGFRCPRRFRLVNTPSRRGGS
ncbi:MAG: hypothetical protein HY343_06950 [Lentisphaerae bacterium]|nr:hypothetical protein [Lentisphaerota bacterium]